MSLEDFRDYVYIKFSTSNIREIEFYKSVHTGQHFALVAVADKDGFCSDGFLVADERHRAKRKVRSVNCTKFYVQKIPAGWCFRLYNLLKKLIKDKNAKDFAFRVYDTGRDCYCHPDKYLVKGDIIQRGLHEGVYIGNGMVIYNTNGKNICKTTLKEFAGGPSIKIRVVDYCVQRKTPDEICTLAESFLKFDQKYNLVWNNCQHFTFLCATGVELLTDRQQFTEEVVVSGIIITVAKWGPLHCLAKRKRKAHGVTMQMATIETVTAFLDVHTSFVRTERSPEPKLDKSDVALRLEPRSQERRVTFTPDTIDNEHMGRLKNKRRPFLVPLRRGDGNITNTTTNNGIKAIGKGIACFFTLSQKVNQYI